MRIAVNSRLLVPGKTDGIARFTLESFKRICAEHPEVEFTFIFDRNPTSFDFGKNTQNISLSPQARHPVLWYLWFEVRLKNYLNKNGFDLFISPEGWVPPKLNMPSLAVVHDLNFIHLPENVAPSHRKFLHRYFPKYIERANRIATVSEYSKNDIAQTFDLAVSEIDVVYNGVNDSFQELDESTKEAVRSKYFNGHDYFLFVGTLHPRKNLENLFLGFDQFKKKKANETKLAIVGNRKWWPVELERIYSSMEFKEDVIFLGRLEDEDVSKLLSASIALSYLPHFEGFGIPILEAFACGTAVITANNTSLPEVAGDAAILCDSRDPDEISAAMFKLKTQPDERKLLLEKGKERLKQFSWDKTAKRLWSSVLRTLESDDS